MPLQPQVLIEPFEKWYSKFVGPINPITIGKKYILVSAWRISKYLGIWK